MLIKKFNKKKGTYTVIFQIPCEQLPEEVVASQVNVVGTFNNWSIAETPMKVAEGIGYEAVLKLKPGKYEYRYLINDQIWYNDWEADGYEPNRLQNADNCLLILDKPQKEKKEKAKKGKKGKKGKKADAKAKGKKEPKNKKDSKGKKEKESKGASQRLAKAQSEIAPVSAAAKPDDLKKIEGIGPKISSVLSEAGITTFNKLATLTVEEIKEALAGKVRISHPESWPEQAQLAAEGAWEQLKALQESLVGGRKR